MNKFFMRKVAKRPQYIDNMEYMQADDPQQVNNLIASRAGEQFAPVIYELFSKQGFKDMGNALHDTLINAGQGIVDGSAAVINGPVKLTKSVVDLAFPNSGFSRGANKFINYINDKRKITNDYWDERKAADGTDWSKNNAGAQVARAATTFLPATAAASGITKALEAHKKMGLARNATKGIAGELSKGGTSVAMNAAERSAVNSAPVMADTTTNAPDTMSAIDNIDTLYTAGNYVPNAAY